MEKEVEGLSDANGVEKLLEEAGRHGRVTVTRDGRPIGVLLPYDEERERWYRTVKEEIAKAHLGLSSKNRHERPIL